MKRTLFILVLISIFLLSACAPALPTAGPATAIPVAASATLPAPSATPVPAATATPMPAATATRVPPSPTPLPPTPTQKPVYLHLVVFGSDQTVQLVNTNIQVGSGYNPAFTGFLPAGGATGGTAYVLNYNSPTKAQAVNAKGASDLGFIKDANYGLALWSRGPNTQPKLAWGTQLTDKAPSSLNISGLDGSNLETLFTLPAGQTPYMQLLAEGWSADGKTLYFSKEPFGIGGYILFDGASNLYSIDVSTKKVTEIIPQSTRMLCLDAISADFSLVADHCTANVITIRDLVKKTSSTIQPPAGLTSFQVMGSARFSPDGKRVAFALGKNDPSAEQGWVAVSDSLSGASKLILTGKAAVSYTIIGWLDDSTLLVQSNAIQCDTTCTNQLWTVGTDGSNPVKVADGSLLTVMDNR